jgi:P4 family phage/plasmid primase-like protien
MSRECRSVERSPIPQVRPLTLFRNGFRELVSVVPPHAPLSPRSTLANSSLGKAPGKKYSTGLWGGYDWLHHIATEEDVKQWAQDGANIGLLAEQYPAVDIDVLDDTLANIITDIVQASLGAAPVRVGRPPKRLLMYRLEGEPFGRMGMRLARGSKEYLVEVLGAGRQYLVLGTHPSGHSYTWSCDLESLTPDHLTPVTRAKVETMFAALSEQLEALGWECVVQGERTGERPEVVQESLKAPSLAALREAVAMIPNPADMDRDGYIRMGFAIRAASQDDEWEGLAIYQEWASRWEGGTNDPDVVQRDWRGLAGPYAIGWSWIEQVAKRYGYVGGAEFSELADQEGGEDSRPADTGSYVPNSRSEKALAREVYKEHGHRIRYMAPARAWLVWDGSKWKRDATAEAEELAGFALDRIASELMTHGGSANEKRLNKAWTEVLGSAWKREAVLKFLKTDQRIAITPEQLDADPWLLNTPLGIVNLKTGNLSPPDSALLCSRTTAVGPDFEVGCARWMSFLEEATGGDADVIVFLQRWFGYCLTGVTFEQKLVVNWGPGGNGKSVMANLMIYLLHEYARSAPSSTFARSHAERHPTDIAGLQGARLVVATETQGGSAWDEEKIKQLSGGDRVSARFMRGDFFDFNPQFKLLVLGNHKPEIRNVDAALRRRVLLVPFTMTPKVVDPLLLETLKGEAPAILAWMIRGCLDWQQKGLAIPALVRDATEEYFSSEDAIGRWIQERCMESPEHTTATNDLFDSWREWAHHNNEYVGSLKRFAQAVAAKGFSRWKDPKSRRHGFSGLRILSDAERSER